MQWAYHRAGNFFVLVSVGIGKIGAGKLRLDVAVIARRGNLWFGPDDDGGLPKERAA